MSPATLRMLIAVRTPQVLDQVVDFLVEVLCKGVVSMTSTRWPHDAVAHTVEEPDYLHHTRGVHQPRNQTTELHRRPLNELAARSGRLEHQKVTVRSRRHKQAFALRL
jgi:hypothetical protein